MPAPPTFPLSNYLMTMVIIISASITLLCNSAWGSWNRKESSQERGKLRGGVERGEKSR